ncbi:hypothetical protein LCGC14_0259500 [marine sediment metagenome]|uniref:Uncharacterized protein n=1 Tax=marine sediment metagenome TaxID=412755 RepID=A0A0F9U2M2_9ZZZZ
MNDSPATHTGTMTWPLDSMNGPEGERLIQLRECEYGWMGDGFRWKADGSAPRALVTDGKWIETYFGLRVNSIRPRPVEELREFYQRAVDHSATQLGQLGQEQASLNRVLAIVHKEQVLALAALGAFDEEHGTGGET